MLGNTGKGIIISTLLDHINFFIIVKFGSLKIFIYLCKVIRNNIAPWCNGSTIDFGSISIGSNPIGVTISSLISMEIMWDF